MGYTHYFAAKQSINDEAWSNICSYSKKVLKEEKNKGIAFETNHNLSTKMVNEKLGYINFNGFGDGSYETFHINKESDGKFNFTKTAHRPYDHAVMRVLLIIDHFAPNALEISSDGDTDAWIPAALENKASFGLGCKIPQGIRGEDREQFNAKVESEMKESTKKTTKTKAPRKFNI